MNKHLSNIHDPTHKNAMQYHCFSSEAMWNPEAMRREWQQHLDWIARNKIGPPKATATFTRAELEAQGMVGLYAATRNSP